MGEGTHTSSNFRSTFIAKRLLGDENEIFEFSDEDLVYVFQIIYDIH